MIAACNEHALQHYIIWFIHSTFNKRQKSSRFCFSSLTQRRENELKRNDSTHPTDPAVKSSVWILNEKFKHITLLVSEVCIISPNIMNSVFVFLLALALAGLCRNAEASTIHVHNGGNHHTAHNIISATLEKSPQKRSKQSFKYYCAIPYSTIVM